MHALGDALGYSDAAPLAAFIDIVNEWLSQQLDNEAFDQARLARVAQTWERINLTARDAEEYNLDRKPLVFTVFDLLAEAARP
jgi:DNA polymerase-3 subunit delta'